MKSYETPQEYVNEARHDGAGHSEGLTSIATDYRGQRILEAVGLDNIEKAAMPFRSSIHDHSFGGGIENNMIAEITGHEGPMKVRDEVGHQGRERRHVLDRDDHRQILQQGFRNLPIVGE
jgi:hypothetical protein